MFQSCETLLSAQGFGLGELSQNPDPHDSLPLKIMRAQAGKAAINALDSSASLVPGHMKTESHRIMNNRLLMGTPAMNYGFVLCRCLKTPFFAAQCPVNGVSYSVDTGVL